MSVIDDSGGVTVEWPDRRADVLNGLDALAALAGGPEPVPETPWPDLTNAVHWVVDDTWWDHEDPRASIGTLLVDEEEAAAVAEVVREIVGVSERQGSIGPAEAWFGDEAWPRVRAAAGNAAAVMRRNGRTRR